MKKCQPGWLLGNVYTTGITETNKTDNTKCWKRCEVIGYLIYYCWGYKMIKPPWKSIWRFLIKMSINLPYDATFPCLGIYLNRCKHVHKKDLYKMFLSPLLIIAYLETTEMSISRSADKLLSLFVQWKAIQQQKGLNHATWDNMVESQKHAQWKKSLTQRNPYIVILWNSRMDKINLLG